jgi:hypothetical protein
MGDAITAGFARWSRRRSAPGSEGKDGSGESVTSVEIEFDDWRDPKSKFFAKLGHLPLHDVVVVDCALYAASMRAFGEVLAPALAERNFDFSRLGSALKEAHVSLRPEEGGSAEPARGKIYSADERTITERLTRDDDVVERDNIDLVQVTRLYDGQGRCCATCATLGSLFAKSRGAQRRGRAKERVANQQMVDADFSFAPPGRVGATSPDHVFVGPPGDARRCLGLVTQRRAFALFTGSGDHVNSRMILYVFRQAAQLFFQQSTGKTMELMAIASFSVTYRRFVEFSTQMTIECVGQERHPCSAFPKFDEDAAERPSLRGLPFDEWAGSSEFFEARLELSQRDQVCAETRMFLVVPQRSAL